MNFPSSVLSILLLLSLFHLHPLPCLALRKLEDAQVVRYISSSDLEIFMKDFQSFGEGGHVHRKELHEVHSGPNPISNTIPQQKWATRLPRHP
ncbi:conserved hypothetical protein [Ricinus communis]|uniref:Uncharacterized protein n=1 Tax=Ricinus communis TaxID=3988 RepID=B9SR63_RICCO|nr:conserved hypothetical protein [Ricinus communis]